ncbi:ABC-type metal ion transport system periplasmic component/surface adhesin [Methanonatronarchaeum thermophilum]|uniref:ABC-type metal ion transport system periplasmic component/surface adhesin n=1 Tax=Methanonatronarchaeum thermophilum TaxID=1927129 RepID=A0A1Y3GDB1_9EURY|nr:zinc ABC transporter substrate-binding protein [Methanonatronarchaeum thermophilum]OUJ19227.1 ABC-type metal ion transport system periplasmic component/surface adhesin [Methanonatronarchaeum thermophilum]
MKITKKQTTLITIILLITIITAGTAYIATDEITQQDADLHIALTIPPQTQIAEKIGGDKITTTTMVPPGEDPHTAEPNPQRLQDLSKADIYFKIGSGLEFEDRHMDTITEQNKNMKIADSSQNITLQDMEHTCCPDCNHDHDHDHDHNHDYKDPHIWLSPSNVVQMTENLLEVMVELDPENADYYEQNAEQYISNLKSIDNEIKTGLMNHSEEKFMIFHPSLGYFAHEYNLEQIPIEEEGEEPGPAGQQRIIDQAREEGIQTIFVSPEFDQSAAQSIADEIDGEVVLLNPLEKELDDNLLDIYNKLKDSLE